MSRTRITVAVLFLALSAFLGACSRQQPASAAASLPNQEGVYFITPRNGDTVANPVIVRFGLRGRGVAPANVNLPNTGHHHLLVDVANLPPMNAPVPADANHIHFGGGQTETSVTLAPGSHTLQLVLGDHLHVPLGKEWISEKITVTVK
jgi:hypothetical protein